MISNTNHTFMGFHDFTHSLSVATIGTKGQIVIPRDVREKLGIGPGDKVVLMTRGEHAAVLMPMDNVQEWVNQMTAGIDELKNIADKSQKATKKEL